MCFGLETEATSKTGSTTLENGSVVCQNVVFMVEPQNIEQANFEGLRRSLPCVGAQVSS